jgi:predicted Holliday junction resolvase-like endonuclease
MPRNEVEILLESLRSDRAIWASAPCSHEFRLADSELFYGSNIPKTGKEYLRTLQEELKELDRENKRLLAALTTGFTKKSAEVKLGKTVEKVLPALPGFPHDRGDCRGIFEPIDYIAFVGLCRGNVTRLEFIDVKTGSARLSKVQKEIKDVVEEGKVVLRELGK